MCGVLERVREPLRVGSGFAKLLEAANPLGPRRLLLDQPHDSLAFGSGFAKPRAA